MSGLHVGILAVADMEVLDFAGPHEAFTVAGELGGAGPVRVSSIGVDGCGPVVARGGLTIVPDLALADVADLAAPGERLDVVLVPGGAGVRALLHRDDVHAWLRSLAGEPDVTVLSVCTGALVLAAAGLLVDRAATTHHTCLDELRALSPSTRVVAGERFVRADERLWTSAGVSAGVDLALHVVGLLLGAEARAAAVAEMEWGW